MYLNSKYKLKKDDIHHKLQGIFIIPNDLLHKVMMQPISTVFLSTSQNANKIHIL